MRKILLRIYMIIWVPIVTIVIAISFIFGIPWHLMAGHGIQELKELVNGIKKDTAWLWIKE